MKTGTVSSSDIAKFGDNLSAKYLLLAKEHEPLFDELIAKFTITELIELAKSLPYDHQAATCVLPSMTTGVYASTRGQAYFNEWVSRQAAPVTIDWMGRPLTRSPSRHALKQVAVYCAAAARNALAKLLTEMLDLRKQELDILKRANGLLEAAKAKGCAVLHEALKGPKGVGDLLTEVKE